jgi:hypothetical protein
LLRCDRIEPDLRNEEKGRRRGEERRGREGRGEREEGEVEERRRGW